MEPKSPSPNASPELNSSALSPERPEVIITNQEIAPVLPQPEKQPKKHERVDQVTPTVDPTQQAQTTTLVNPPVPATDDASSTRDDVTTPAVAADEDKIEKEWVNKAKSIVEQTKSDPYLQEERVSKLQADYLQKRYNKKVKLSGD